MKGVIRNKRSGHEIEGNPKHPYLSDNA